MFSNRISQARVILADILKKIRSFTSLLVKCVKKDTLKKNSTLLL